MTNEPTTEPMMPLQPWEKMRRVGLYAPGHNQEAVDSSRATIAAAYSNPGQTENERRREAGRAEGWRYDAQLEHLDQLRTNDPAGFAKLPPTSKISLGLYLEGRAAAKAAGINTDAPR